MNTNINSAKLYDGGNGRDFSADVAFYRSLLKPKMHVLDVGCGTGRVALQMAQHDIFISRVSCVDFSSATH